MEPVMEVRWNFATGEIRFKPRHVFELRGSTKRSFTEVCRDVVSSRWKRSG